jgi:hypothetical protein
MMEGGQEELKYSSINTANQLIDPHVYIDVSLAQTGDHIKH